VNLGCVSGWKARVRLDADRDVKRGSYGSSRGMREGVREIIL
jgi:hypothetical protein